MRPEVRLDFTTVVDRPVPFAERMVESVGRDQGFLFWVTEYGIWAPLEDRYLFNVLRRSDGEARQLHEAPGHVFDAGEHEKLISYLHLATTFGWGGALLGLSGLNRVVLSHDQWLSIRAPNAPGSLDGFELPARDEQREISTFAALFLDSNGQPLPGEQP